MAAFAAGQGPGEPGYLQTAAGEGGGFGFSRAGALQKGWLPEALNTCQCADFGFSLTGSLAGTFLGVASHEAFRWECRLFGEPELVFTSRQIRVF